MPELPVLDGPSNLMTNYNQIFSDWAKGKGLEYLKPEQRRAVPLIVSGCATDAQLDQAGHAFVLGMKESARFSTRSSVVGPISKAVADSFVIPWVLSDESVDRMGDVIRADGWELDEFKKSPVVIWGHGKGVDSDADEPIGRANNVRVEGKRLVADIEFAAKESERAARKFRLANAGYIKAGSVGFSQKEVDRVDDEDERKKLGLGKHGVLFKRQELLEFSIVAVPANPHALQASVRAGEIRESDAQWFEKDFPQITERDMEKTIRERSRKLIDTDKQMDAVTVLRTLDSEENLRQLVAALTAKKDDSETKLMLEHITALRTIMREVSDDRMKANRELADAVLAMATTHSKLATAITDLGGCLGAFRAQAAPSADASTYTPGSGVSDSILTALEELQRQARRRT